MTKKCSDKEDKTGPQSKTQNKIGLQQAPGKLRTPRETNCVILPKEKSELNFQHCFFTQLAESAAVEGQPRKHHWQVLVQVKIICPDDVGTEHRLSQSSRLSKITTKTFSSHFYAPNITTMGPSLAAKYYYHGSFSGCRSFTSFQRPGGA